MVHERGVAVALLMATVFLSCLSSTLALNYTLRDEITGGQFLNKFYFWSYGDPTDGTVDYVDQFTASANGLAYVNSAGHFVMRADNKTIIPLTSTKGRPSVRIHSKRKVGDGVVVAKFAHMPQGCGTWPAYWTCTTSRWPAGGEVDIVEGANDQGPRNLASLHTRYGCHIPAGYRGDQTGFSGQTDCSYQPGCSSSFVANSSFGPDFNSNGGGFFALRRETQLGGPGIGVYFWPASTASSSLPAVVAATADGRSAPMYVVTDANATGTDLTELRKWGNPSAFFPNTANATASTTALATGDGSVCQMSNYFDDHEIIINLTFCGYWAGETFGVSGCSARYGNVSCEDFVRQNPTAFNDARWEIEYLRIYDSSPAALAFGKLPSYLSLLLSTISIAVLVSSL